MRLALLLLLALPVSAAAAPRDHLAPEAPPAPPSPPDAPDAPAPPAPPPPPDVSLPPGGHAQVLQQVRAHEPEILAAVQARDPGRHAQLMALKIADPALYLHELVQAARTLERVREDPAAMGRAAEMRRLGDELRTKGLALREIADEGGKIAKEQRAELEALSGELFELRQEERRARLLELRGKIDELQDEIEEREAEREEIIEDYVDSLIEGKPEL